MNVHIAIIAALFAVAASAQARTLVPVQPASAAPDIARRVAGPAVAIAPTAYAPVQFPATTVTLPPKSAVAVPVGFGSWAFHPPSLIGYPFHGHVHVRGPDTRQPPVIPEAPSSAP